MSNEAWPSSPFEAWRDIYANLMAAPAQLELSVRINRKLSELAHRETANLLAQ